MTSDTTKPYSVNLWGSNPDDDNDDCHTGEFFSTDEEAQAVFENPWSVFDRTRNEAITAVFEIEGPGVYERRANPEYLDTSDADNDEWRREFAMQSGMAFGCQGFNDAMGW